MTQCDVICQAVVIIIMVGMGVLSILALRSQNRAREELRALRKEREREAEGLNQEEVKGLNRVKEIMRMAHKLKWVYPPNQTSCPLMKLSEVEKCMLAMYNDFDLNRMRKWVEETQSSEQTTKEGEAG